MQVGISSIHPIIKQQVISKLGPEGPELRKPWFPVLDDPAVKLGKLTYQEIVVLNTLIWELSPFPPYLSPTLAMLKINIKTHHLQKDFPQCAKA